MCMTFDWHIAIRNPYGEYNISQHIFWIVQYVHRTMYAMYVGKYYVSNTLY